MISNPNEAVVPADGYPREWHDAGAKASGIALPKQTNAAFTQYFYYRGEIQKLALKSELSTNDDYLQVSCDQKAKIEECDKDCASYLNEPLKAEDVSRWTDLTVPLPNENLASLFSLELSVPREKAGSIDTSAGKIAQIAIKAITEIGPSADLTALPMKYLIYRVASMEYPVINSLVDASPWKIKLLRNQTPSQRH